jgi:hypothetical protein
MMKLFEYVYYNLNEVYSKKERGDRGPWMVICLIQLFFLMDIIYLPIVLYLGRGWHGKFDDISKNTIIIVSVSVMIFNHFYFNGKLNSLKKKYGAEPESQRKRNSWLIYLSLLGLFLVFFISILIRDGGFVKKKPKRYSIELNQIKSDLASSLHTDNCRFQ